MSRTSHINMANTKQISLKVYYLENGVNKEIRKFTLDQDMATNYEYLIGRIKVFFTGLLRNDLQIYWKDGEDDYISVSSDSELFEIMKDIPRGDDVGCLKLYIQVKGSKSVPINNHHPGIACDGCDSSINGIRYKCTVCPDYDLCSTCERKMSHPIEHDMLCIKKPCSKMGSFRRCSPWSQMGRSYLKFVPQSNCPFQQFNKPTYSKEKESKSDIENETVCKEFIVQIASAFGLDPDVAVSQTQSFLDHLHSQAKPECDNQNDEEVNVPEQMSGNTEQMFGINPEGLKDIEHCCEKELPEEKQSSQCGYEESNKGSLNVSDAVNMEYTSVVDGEEVKPTSHPTCSNSKDEFMDGATPFLNQMGIGSELPEEQFKNLGKIIGNAMQNIGSHFNSVPSTCNDSKEFTSHTEKTRSDEFVFVDKTDKKKEITEEEVFERQLNQSLLQMEAMGFDNDGDWLTQLLVAKDLDISRVLDALHPPNA